MCPPGIPDERHGKDGWYYYKDHQEYCDGQACGRYQGAKKIHTMSMMEYIGEGWKADSQEDPRRCYHDQTINMAVKSSAMPLHQAPPFFSMTLYVQVVLPLPIVPLGGGEIACVYQVGDSGDTGGVVG